MKKTQEPSADLVTTIEKKDKRFRFFQTMFMIGVVITLLIIIGGQQVILQNIQSQLAQAKTSSEQQAKATQASQDVILRRLDCLAQFFSQTDRTELSIDDIDRCTLNNNGDVQQFFGTSKTPTETTPVTKTENATTTDTGTTTTVQPTGLVTIPIPVFGQKTCVLGLLCVN